MSEDRRTPEQDPDRPGGTGAQPRQRLRLLLLVAATLFALDLVTKVIVVARIRPGEPVSLVGDVVELVLVRNPGAAFSMATGMTWLLTLIATAVVIGVLRIGRTLRSPLWAIGLGGVLGGALGNLMDRLFRAPGPLQGHVVDFVSVGWWPVFNVADSSIVCGAILLVALTVFGFEPDGTRYKDKATAETGAASEPAGDSAPDPAEGPGTGRDSSADDSALKDTVTAPAPEAAAPGDEATGSTAPGGAAAGKPPAQGDTAGKATDSKETAA
ncbi:lipoprotein signal peptidase [Nocardia jinanensis]|uniref:Lipoprotein signal peptidase n=1 Tax=Nocardia jinanensis TaxID=382504 RepID=A0A917RFP5_9NOCA|nr:lipoprotein signal peptidase [Nocardia jinanensis]